jgi:hypothetical protein
VASKLQGCQPMIVYIEEATTWCGLGSEGGWGGGGHMAHVQVRNHHPSVHVQKLYRTSVRGSITMRSADAPLRYTTPP